VSSISQVNLSISSVLSISDLRLKIIYIPLVCFMKAQIRQEPAHPSYSGEDASIPLSVPTHGENLTRSWYLLQVVNIDDPNAQWMISQGNPVSAPPAPNSIHCLVFFLLLVVYMCRLLQNHKRQYQFEFLYLEVCCATHVFTKLCVP
jgi:hypothetical protein